MTTWRDNAACRGTDLTVFSPETRTEVEAAVVQAKEVCGRCPVRRDCLEFEISKGLPQFGWFGGRSAYEREAIIRKRERRRAAA